MKVEQLFIRGSNPFHVLMRQEGLGLLRFLLLVVVAKDESDDYTSCDTNFPCLLTLANNKIVVVVRVEQRRRRP